MTNEILFFIQIFVIIALSFGALKLGKEALIGWIALLTLGANLFVLKQVDLFGLRVTGSECAIIGGMVSLSLLQEYFGNKLAKKTTAICFYLLIAFCLLSQLMMRYIPNSTDQAQEHLHFLFSPFSRILCVSLIVLLLAQRIEIGLFQLLKRLMPKRSLGLRSMISCSLSQLFDTIAFTFVGLGSLITSPFHVIILSFAIKALILCCMTPLLNLARLIHKKEQDESVLI